MALIITTWFWGDKYGEHYVKKLASAVHRNLTEAHRFIAFTDSPRHLPGIEQYTIPDMRLTAIPGCFVRLRLFDPEWQAKCGINPGDRVVNMDLDLVVTGPLDPLFDRKDDFTILQNINTTNKCPYNGSIWMLKAGARPDVWSDFSLENYHKLGVPFHAFPDDQGWFHYKMPDAGSWGPADGVYGYKKKGWPGADGIPESQLADKNTRVVVFPGWRDPDKFNHLKWIRDHWR